MPDQPTGPGQLRDRLAEALRTTPSVLMDTPEERARHAATTRNHHVTHHYYWGCAMCRGEVDTLATAQAAVVQPLLDAKDTERDRYRLAWLSSRRRASRAVQHVEELQDKLLSFGVNGGCCCSYDNPGDICMVHSPTVRHLEAELAAAKETAAERQQNALHWQERAEESDRMLDQASDEIERINTELAGYELHFGPPPRTVTDLPDIDQHQETP